MYINTKKRESIVIVYRISQAVGPGRPLAAGAAFRSFCSNRCVFCILVRRSVDVPVSIPFCLMQMFFRVIAVCMTVVCITTTIKIL